MALAVITAFMAVSGSANAVFIGYRLNDHPAGSEGGDYGLRLDDPADGSTNTFGFVDVTAWINTDTGEFVISGEIAHRQDSDESYTLSAVINITSPIVASELLSPDGSFERLFGFTESLHLTPNNSGTFEPVDWEGFSPYMDQQGEWETDFRIDTNHRGVGANTLSGWGWLAPEGDRSKHLDYQDWLFTMERSHDIPEPGTLTLLSLGLIGFARRRKKRKV